MSSSPALLIRGGTVVNADREFAADVLCLDGKIAAVGARGAHLVAVHPHLERVVALDARVVRAEEQLELVARRLPDRFVVLRPHRRTSSGRVVMPPPFASISASHSGR